MKLLKMISIFGVLYPFLTKNERNRLYFYLFINIFLSFIDVLSMIIIGLAASNVVSVVQSKPQNISGVVSNLLSKLNSYYKIDYKTFLMILIILSLILLIIKSFYSRKVFEMQQKNLSKILVRVSQIYLELYFKTPLNLRKDLSKGDLINNFQIGLDSLIFQNFGIRVQIVCEIFGILLLLLPIFVVAPPVIFFGIFSLVLIKAKSLKRFMDNSKRLGATMSTSYKNYTNSIILISESEDEIFNKTTLFSLLNESRQYEEEFSQVKAKKLIEQTTPRFILEIVAIGLLIPIAIIIGIFLSISSALLLLSYAFIFLLRVVPSMSRILSFFVILKQHQILAYNIANQFYSLTKLSSRITDSNRVISFTSMNRIRFQDYQLISPSGELIKKNINVDFVGNGINLIQGKNGSGKSTLLKSITGQVLSNSGSLVINVMNQSKNLEDRIQFLSQHSGVSSKTLNSNIDLGSNLSQLESDEAYKILSKLNYVFLNAQKVLKGSGGEIQKVFISRILCKNADIFLLDEPTNHLDKKSHKELAEIIIDKSRHSLILVASHDDQFISLLPINTSYLI